jgi:hypothetical protein
MPDGTTPTTQAGKTIKLPTSVHQVLLNHQATLWQVRALVRSLTLMADSEKDADRENVAYGLDAVAALLQPVCERLESGALAQDAAALEAEEQEAAVA